MLNIILMAIKLHLTPFNIIHVILVGYVYVRVDLRETEMIHLILFIGWKLHAKSKFPWHH